jgi:hypothetical protein
MRDPHVVSLQYRLETDPGVTFQNPPPVEAETEAFLVRLDNGVATFQLKDHFPSEEGARRVVDAYVRAWEIATALRYDRQEIKFVFEKAEVVDLKPPPPGSNEVVALPGVFTVSAVGSVTLPVERTQYPTPPMGFEASPDVETLWQRYEGYRRGQEALPGMANFCLSLIQTLAGGREEAAGLFHISMGVLRKLGDLAANRGDERTARKVPASGVLTPLSPQEQAWIEAAIKVIIRRVGEGRVNPSLPEITMSDLPSL